MPDDRTRTPAARSEDLEFADLDAEHTAELEAAWLAESRRRLNDLDAGRESAIDWDEAQESVFAPPSPEELEAAWLAEALEGAARMDAGLEQGIPWEDVRAEIVKTLEQYPTSSGRARR